MRKNSSADLRGSRIKSDITATASAPASMTDRQFSRVIPPIATSGLRVNALAWRTPSRPITGSGLRLAPRLEDRTDRQIVCTGSVGLDQLLGIVGRNAQPEAVTDHGSGAFGREIILSHVDSIEAGSQAQVCPIVHDQFDGTGEATSQLPGLVQHQAGVARLVPVLHQGDATCDQFAGCQAKAFCIRERRRIEDSVKAGKGIHRRLCGAGALARRL